MYLFNTQWTTLVYDGSLLMDDRFRFELLYVYSRR